MRILLDECLPRELADELVGHEVRTVQQEGWSGLENGALLLRASGTFSIFITIDKHIERTQRLPANLSVVTLRARTNRIESLRPLVPSDDLDRWLRAGYDCSNSEPGEKSRADTIRHPGRLVLPHPLVGRFDFLDLDLLPA